MPLRGRFHLEYKGQKWIQDNFILDGGEESFLKMITQGDVTDIALGGNWYVGLCGSNTLTESSVLADISDEVGTSNGYARQALTRDLTGWPTVARVDPYFRALSATATFTASGGDFDATFTRPFLTNASAGTTGILYAVANPLLTPVLVLDTESFNLNYELYLA